MLGEVYLFYRRTRPQWSALWVGEDCIELRVMDDAGAAAVAHARAVAQLLVLDAGSELRHLQRVLPGMRELGLLAALFGHRRAPLAALLLGAARRLLTHRAAPRTTDDYLALRQDFHAALADELGDTAAGLLGLFERAAALRGSLARVPAAVRADLEAQLGLLLGPLAMDYMDKSGLACSLRALDAIARRLERVESNPGKDLRKLADVAPLAARLLALCKQSGELTAALRAVQLMLEDYRISVFAPELGVASHVAASHIEAALRVLEADRK